MFLKKMLDGMSNLNEGGTKTKDMKILKKLWIKIISIVSELLANILLFHTSVKFKRFVFMNFYKIVIASILIILGIIMYFILKFLV